MPMKTNNTFFLYARKSTDVEDKQIMSIDAQLFELRQFASREQLTITDELIEKQSAKIPGRPIFNDMLARIEAGEASGILSWHPDRLARNSVDGGRLIYLLDTGKLTALKFPGTFWFENTSQGKFMLGLAFAQSKQYVDALSENTKRGLREKVRRGEFPAMAPIGYLNDYRTKRIIIDPGTAPLVKESFERYATGAWTLDSLREFLGEKNLRTPNGKLVGRSYVSRMLSNPMYYGHFLYKEEVHEGCHEPLIAKNLFDQVQAVLNRRWRCSPVEKKTPPKAFLGLLRCGECGSAVTGEIQKGHVYYRCTKKNRAQKCSQPYIREEALDSQISALLSPYTLPDGWAEKMLTLWDREKNGLSQESATVAAEKRAEIAKLNQRLQRLTDSFLDAIIEREIYTAEKAKIMSRRKTLQEQVENCAQAKNDWLEPFKTWILTAKTTGKIALEGSLSEKRVLAQEVFGSNLILDRKKARGSSVNPWFHLTEKSPCGGMVGWPGLEPGTNALKGHCSTN
jgi:site-specific DNA recombinase